MCIFHPVSAPLKSASSGYLQPRRTASDRTQISCYRFLRYRLQSEWIFEQENPLFDPKGRRRHRATVRFYSSNFLPERPEDPTKGHHRFHPFSGKFIGFHIILLLFGLYRVLTRRVDSQQSQQTLGAFCWSTKSVPLLSTVEDGHQVC